MKWIGIQVENKTSRLQKTDLHDFQDEGRVLEIVFQAKVDLSDVLRRLRIVDVHVHQRYGTVLPKGHLHTTGESRNKTKKKKEQYGITIYDERNTQ